MHQNTKSSPAILNGKWILTAEWLQACAKAGKLVDEESYEVFLDTHGASGGPKARRLRIEETSCLFVCTCKSDEYIVAHYCSGCSDGHCSYRPTMAPKKWQVLRHELKSRTHDEKIRMMAGPFPDSKMQS